MEGYNIYLYCPKCCNFDKYVIKSLNEEETFKCTNDGCDSDIIYTPEIPIPGVRAKSGEIFDRVIASVKNKERGE